jgi:uncharacterized protein (DUF1778 family)
VAKESERTQVKVFFNADELRLVKLAAVNGGVTASEFIRRAVLKAAAQEMRDFVPPILTQESGPGRSKRHR